MKIKKRSGDRIVVMDQLYRVLACERFVHRYCHSSRSSSTMAPVIALDAAPVPQCIFWFVEVLH
ncbi:TPA: hypothetical protein ACH3X1_014771 [Trebouxia sp. C0004]